MENKSGLAVRVNNENEFNRIKEFLGPDVLYLDWVPQMATTPMAVVVFHKIVDIYSPGKVGAIELYENSGDMRIVSFNEYFK